MKILPGLYLSCLRNAWWNVEGCRVNYGKGGPGQAKVRSELHVCQTGGHGCGLRESAAGVTTWPRHCERRLREIKVLPRKQDHRP